MEGDVVAEPAGAHMLTERVFELAFAHHVQQRVPMRLHDTAHHLHRQQRVLLGRQPPGVEDVETPGRKSVDRPHAPRVEALARIHAERV